MPKPDDPDIIDRFTTAIRKGHGVASAATLAGVAHNTMYVWLQQGDADIEAREASSHATLTTAFKQAEAECIDARLGVIEAVTLGGGDKAWLPAMTLIERRWPKVYGRQQYVDIHEERTLTLKLELPPAAVAALTRTLDNTKLLAAPAEGSQEAE